VWWEVAVDAGGARVAHDLPARRVGEGVGDHAEDGVAHFDPAVAGGEVVGGGTDLEVVADGTLATSTGNVITHNHSSHNRPADIVEDDVGAANVTTGNRCHTSIPGGLCQRF
jgi:hypothetical protein